MSVEFHEIDQPLLPARATYIRPQNTLCGLRGDMSTDSQLTSEDLFHRLNDIRSGLNLPTLTPTSKWYAPLAAWLDRLSEGATPSPIIGLLDGRGWALPRYEALRIHASTVSEFKGLLTTMPSFVRLMRAPNMTHMSIIPIKNTPGFLVVLFHLPESSTTYAFEQAFLADLNRFRNHRGHGPLHLLPQPPSTVVETDCASGVESLKKLLGSSSVDQIWLRVFRSRPDYANPVAPLNTAPP